MSGSPDPTAAFVRGMIDFSTWQGVLSTLAGLVLFSLVVVGIRLAFMQTVQRRRERENRQINERLRTLIAAYKTLGGSFTGNLLVDPTHLRDLRMRAAGDPAGADRPTDPEDGRRGPAPGSERRRRMRDAVEAALSDIILLGTEEQVRLAARAAQDMVAGRSVETADLVVSLRTFIRAALDLEPVPPDAAIPRQGPLRPGSAAARATRDGGAPAARGGRGGGGAGAGAGGGAAMGFGAGRSVDDAG